MPFGVFLKVDNDVSFHYMQHLYHFNGCILVENVYNHQCIRKLVRF